MKFEHKKENDDYVETKRKHEKFSKTNQTKQCSHIMRFYLRLKEKIQQEYNRVKKLHIYQNENRDRQILRFKG